MKRKSNNHQRVIYGVYDQHGVIKYVGITIDLKRRFIGHIKERNFEVTGIKVLEWVTKANWSDREKYWITFYQKNNLENKNRGGFGPGIVSEKTRKLISEKLKGIKRSDEFKRNLSLLKKGVSIPGRPHRKESKEKNRIKALEQWSKRTPEQILEVRKKISEGLKYLDRTGPNGSFYGKTHTEASLIKMGKGSSKSEEERLKISIATKEGMRKYKLRKQGVCVECMGFVVKNEETKQEECNCVSTHQHQTEIIA